MLDCTQVGVLERSKRRIVYALGLTLCSLVVCSTLRLVPGLDDALAGKPEYAHFLTESTGRQIAAQSGSPVIVEPDENGFCPEVTTPPVPEEQIQGTLYVLTYSERQHVTCMTAYVVPADASRLPNLRSITPSEGETYGPTLLSSVKAVPFYSDLRVYPPEYLKRLHWRYQQHFPLSEAEAATMASRSYYSGSREPTGTANIDLNFEEIRAQVAKRHRQVNFRLMLALTGCGVAGLGLVAKLVSLYKTFSRYLGLYGAELAARSFFTENIGEKARAARQRYFERQQENQERLREEERLRVIRIGWEEGLRSALPTLTDERLRTRVEKCLEETHADLDDMKALWMEVQAHAGQRTPRERLDLLVESIRPYCNEDELATCRKEAFAMLNRSGFRAARKLATGMHDQFKMRAREMEEMENSDQNADAKSV